MGAAIQGEPMNPDYLGDVLALLAIVSILGLLLSL
jgi:hypothetical protein